MYKFLLFSLIAIHSFSQTILPNVKIKGQILKKGYTHARISRFDYILELDSTFTTVEVDTNGNFEFNHYFNEPIIVRMFNVPVYITPGDNVELTIDGSFNVVKAMGANHDNYCILREMQKKYKFISPYKYVSNWDVYKDSVYTGYKKAIDFLNKSSDSLRMSATLKNAIKLDRDIQYFNDLFEPIVANQTKAKYLSEEYLNEMFKGKQYIKDESFLSPRYPDFLNGYIRAKDTCTLESAHFVKFKSVVNTILTNLSGKSKEVTLLKTVNKYVSYGILDHETEFDKLIPLIKTAIKTPRYQSKLVEILSRYKFTNRPFEATVRNAYLYNDSLGAIKFSEIIRQNSTKFIYIDFWASWCGPCIEQMKYSKTLEDEFKDKIEVVYISIDKDKSAWLKSSVKNKIVSSNYWINANDEVFSKSLMIAEIPRYILVHKNGNIAMWDAPKPSERTKIKEILNQLK